MDCVTFIVEDEHEHVDTVQLYFQEEENVRPAKFIVDFGTVLLIKEPYCNVIGPGGGHLIRVDHVSDFVRLDQGNDMIPTTWRLQLAESKTTAESLKAQGDLAMSRNQFEEAID